MDYPWKRKDKHAAAAQLRQNSWLGSGLTGLGGGEELLYRAARESLPILDAAISKLVRLAGGFHLETGSEQTDRALDDYLRRLSCGHGGVGADNFLTAYLDSLLMYGRAVGEMVVGGGKLQAVVWGDVTKICVLEDGDPLHTLLADSCTGLPFPRQELLLFSTLHPEPEHPYGVSLLRGLPFFAKTLQKIYETLGRNWERAGDVRYSVVCRSESGGAKERTEQMAREWAKAMSPASGGSVSDFVAVGDVDIHVIGADAPILDSEVPVRELLEQIVAKTGLPPFLLGLSWSTTERMSKQQADLLTSELWALRRTVQPVLERVGDTWLRLEGIGGRCRVRWDEISLQDTAEEAHAALYRAQAERLQTKG